MLKTVVLPARTTVARALVPANERRVRPISLHCIISNFGAVPCLTALGGGVTTLFRCAAAIPDGGFTGSSAVATFQAALAQDPVTGAGTIDFPPIGITTTATPAAPAFLTGPVEVSAVRGGTTVSIENALPMATIAMPEIVLNPGDALCFEVTNNGSCNFGELTYVFEELDEEE